MRLKGAASRHASARGYGNASPAKTLYRMLGNAAGLSIRIRFMKAAMEGTDDQTVSCLSAMKRAGAINWLAGITSTEAPFFQAMNNSKTLTSNVSSEVCETRSVETGSKRGCIAARNRATLPVEIITPLGVPVVPEV